MATDVELITKPCPGTCTLVPCGSPDCCTLTVNRIQPMPSVQCPYCAHWMMGPEQLAAAFQSPFSHSDRPQAITCQACSGRSVLTRTFEPRYQVGKAADGD